MRVCALYILSLMLNAPFLLLCQCNMHIGKAPLRVVCDRERSDQSQVSSTTLMGQELVTRANLVVRMSVNILAGWRYVSSKLAMDDREPGLTLFLCVHTHL